MKNYKNNSNNLRFIYNTESIVYPLTGIGHYTFQLLKAFENHKSSHEIESMILSPLVGRGLTVPKKFEIKDEKSISTIFNAMRGKSRRKDFPQSLGEKWSDWQDFKLKIKFKDEYSTAFLIMFNSKRDLAKYGQLVNIKTHKTSSYLGGDFTSDILFRELNRIINDNNIDWVSSEQEYWDINSSTAKYLGPPAKTEKEWGRENNWKIFIEFDRR